MRKIAALIEIKIVLILTILCIWLRGPVGKHFAYAAVAAVIIGWLARKERTQTWKTFFKELPGELGLVNWTLALLGAMLFLGKVAYSKHLLGYVETPEIIAFFFGYLGWGLAQQLLLNGFLVNRIKECGIGDIATSLAAGTIFGALHLPNPVLVPITFVGGIALAYLFLKWRNLYILAIAQVLVATIVFHTISPNLHHNFRVGPTYYTWAPPKH